MTEPQHNQQERRAARDKSVIDHLMSDAVKPRMDHKHNEAHQHGEGEGHKLDKAIHEHWTAKKGGLPEF
jgi:hypothetical protein